MTELHGGTHRLTTIVRASTSPHPSRVVHLLHSAIRSLNVEAVRVLLQSNTLNLEEFGPYGFTPLSVACKLDLSDCVSLLLERKVDPNGKNADGTTALHWACDSGYSSVVSLLLKHGVSTNVRDDFGMTPLHKAAANGHTAVITLLGASKMCEMDPLDAMGMTPLHNACHHGHTEAVAALIEFGADQTVRISPDSWMPFHFACFKGNPTMVAFLMSKMDPTVLKREIHRGLETATCGNDLEIVRFLLEKGANIDYADKDGRTPVHHASLSGHDKILSFLIKKGARVHVKDKIGMSPLHCACERGHTSCITILMEKGIEPSNKDNTGRTAIDLAARFPDLEGIFTLGKPDTPE